MKAKLLFFVLFCLAILGNAKEVAVLYPSAIGIAPEELSKTREEIQTQVRNSLPESGFEISENSEITHITQNLRGCLGSCLLRSLRNSGKSTDYVVQTSISGSGTDKIYDVSVFKMNGDLVSQKKFNSINDMGEFFKAAFPAPAVAIPAIVAPVPVAPPAPPPPVETPAQPPIAPPEPEPEHVASAEQPSEEQPAKEPIKENEFYPKPGGFNPQPISTNMSREEYKESSAMKTVIGIAMAVAGTGLAVYGYMYDKNAVELYKNDYQNQTGQQARDTWQAIQDAQKIRNISYGAGGALFISCSSTRLVTEQLRKEEIESATSMDDGSIRYYVDRDIEMKTSKRSVSVDKAGKGISQTVTRKRNYALIKEGEPGICKEARDGVLGIAFDSENPDVLLYFVLDSDGYYRVYYEGDGFVKYGEDNFQIQEKPSYWVNRFLTMFSGSGNGREARLKIKYDIEEKETVKTRKAKGYD